MPRPVVPLQLFAFGGAGSRPGLANETIARIAKTKIDDRIVFAEPEVGEELVRQLQLDTGAINHFVYRIPDPPNRRSYLNTTTLNNFAQWIKEDSARLANGIVIVGDYNTSSQVAEQRISLFSKLLQTPGLQQVAAIFGISSDQKSKYKSLAWTSRQIAQLMKTADIQSIDFIGQTFHLRDYATKWMQQEYQRFGINVRDRSDEWPEAEELNVWDPHSSQTWVRSENNWKGLRNYEARIAAYVVPTVHAITHPVSSVPTATTLDASNSSAGLGLSLGMAAS